MTLAIMRGRLAGIKDDLRIVVIKGFGQEPLSIATNTEKNAVMVLETYLTPWKIEETFRFLKQEYALEDIRVRNYYSLKNTFALLAAVFYFLSVHLGRRLKLNVLVKKICEKAKRFFQIPAFNQYALADGIYRILFGTKWADAWRSKPSVKRENQLILEFMRS